jgi:hypothetical protein
MEWLGVLAVSVSPLLLAIHLLASGEDPHAICLKNIGRLESELFPDLPTELRWAKWPPGPWEGDGLGWSPLPGQVWPVKSVNYVQFMPKYDWQSTMMAEALAMEMEKH